MYEKSITREHRTAFMILIDQSGSMVEMVEYDGAKISKSEAVALATNQILSELIERARRHDGVRDYYDVAVVGYSGAGVKSMLSPNDEPFVSIVDLAARDVEIKSHTIERSSLSGVTFSHTISTPEWIIPLHTGETPTFEAFSYCYDNTKKWCSNIENYESFPPIIINITDGESTDCSPSELKTISSKLRSLTTSDGNVFVINIHLASSPEHQSILFPTIDEVEMCTDSKAKHLSQASSIMPQIYNDLICEMRGIKSQTDFVGVSYNSSIAELITILNIGTISVKRG